MVDVGLSRAGIVGRRGRGTGQARNDRPAEETKRGDGQSSKHQGPRSKEVPSSKSQAINTRSAEVGVLLLGNWDFSGVWSLEFGHFFCVHSFKPRSPACGTGEMASASIASPTR